MPALTPLTEGSETLSGLSEGSETLSVLGEASETLTPLAEITNDVTTHVGFYPGLALYSAPYPFPGSAAYPGATYSTAPTGLALDALSEGSETLTPLTET